MPNPFKLLANVENWSVIEPLTTRRCLLKHMEKRSFENIAGKGENAGNQHFLLFPQCFLS